MKKPNDGEDNARVMLFDEDMRRRLKEPVETDGDLDPTALVPALHKTMTEERFGSPTNDGKTGLIRMEHDLSIKRRRGVRAAILALLVAAGIGAGVGVAVKGCTSGDVIASE